MPTLNLRFLGSPQISLDEKPLNGFTTNKAQALLFYLAVTGEIHTRYALATLLWSDASDRQARKNLRNVLYDLRPLVGPYLNITSQTVSFKQSSPHWLDVDTFTTGLKTPLPKMPITRLNEIIGLYRGEFLEGFYVRNTTIFEEWVLMHREHFRKLFIHGLDTLARQCVEQQEYVIGLTATKRLLALEPWRETTHRQQMLCLAHTGQRNAALMQYEMCRQILADELDTTPLAETTRLFEQLKSGQLPLLAESRSQFETLPLSLTIDQASHQPPRNISISSNKSRNDNRSIDPPPLPPVDWGAAPIHTPFYGRQVELNRLAQWVVRDGCRLVAVFGIGGQGKTALSVQLTDALLQNRFPDGSNIEAGGFDRIIWRSLRNAPPFAHLLQDWLQTLSGQSLDQIPDHIDAQLILLFKHLRQQRCLLILDDFHGLLQEDGRHGQFSPGYEAYEQLLVRVARVDHRSCLVLTSREQPREFQYLAIDSSRVRSLPLTGLSQETSHKILQAFGVNGSQEATSTLIRRYSGNPLALKLGSMTIQNLFAGDIDHFIQENILIFDDLQSILEQQLAPLSLLEREIMTWLALDQKPVAFQNLWEYISPSASKWEFLAALQALQRRCLLEKYVDGFAIQNLIAEYLTTNVIETVCREIESKALLSGFTPNGADVGEGQTKSNSLMTAFLNRYALTGCQDSQDDQPEHLLQPIVVHLATKWGTDGLKQHLNHLLDTVQTEAVQPHGYAKVNIYHILKAISRIGSSDKGFSRYKESHFA